MKKLPAQNILLIVSSVIVIILTILSNTSNTLGKDSGDSIKNEEIVEGPKPTTENQEEDSDLESIKAYRVDTTQNEEIQDSSPLESDPVTEESNSFKEQTVFNLRYNKGTGISSSEYPNSSNVQHYDLNAVSSHAVSIKYPKGVEVELSFNGVDFLDTHDHEEGAASSDYSYSNLLYPEEGWEGDIYIRAGSGFEFTAYLIPDQIEISNDSNSIQSLSPSDYSGAMSTTLNIIPRSVWGANTASWDPNDSSEINSFSRLVWDVEFFRHDKIVVHHTATPYTLTPSQAIRDIYLFHTYSRGWGDIAYNYLIDQNGNIYEGKIGGEGVFSYHAYREANEIALSIALIGDFTNSGPTAAAKDSLAKLIAEKSILYDIPITVTDGTQADWLDTNTTIYGHKTSYVWCYPGHPVDYLCPSGPKWVANPTACPGSTFYPIFTTEVLANAQSYKNGSLFSQLKTIVAQVEFQYASDVMAQSGELILVNNSELTQTDVDNLIPPYSGITIKKILGNKLILNIKDWNNSGHVPENGWDGTNVSVFPNDIDWKNERAKTLQKVFLLSGEWDLVTRNYLYLTQ